MSFHETGKVPSGRREDSPPRSKLQVNSDSNKQISFTKFPPLRKNIDEAGEQEPSLQHKHSEKENENQVNASRPLVQFQKKKMDKKKALLLSNVSHVLQVRYRHFKEFLAAVNLSNNLRITNEKTEVRPYVIYVGKGNNSTLIKNIIKNRPWWQLTEDRNDPNINMVWTQLRQNEVLADYKSLKDPDLEDLCYEVDDNAVEEPPSNPAEDSSDNEGKLVKNRTFNRSQSVNHRDIPLSLGSTMKSKRGSSRSK